MVAIIISIIENIVHISYFLVYEVKKMLILWKLLMHIIETFLNNIKTTTYHYTIV